MELRIYTYKVTFEEIPDWYWGAHKEGKHKDGYLGSPATHAWKWEFYTPHLEILEFFPYTDEGWIEAQNVENRCIKPDLNNPLCLNEHYGGVISSEARKRGAKKMHAIIHAEKDDLGRSIHGVKNGERLHREKDDLGRSVNAVKAHKEKDDLGKSAHAVKAGEKGGPATMKEKDDLGRSVQGVKAAERLHKEKDGSGRSVSAVKGAAKTNSQKWKDPQHLELGEHTPGVLVRMQQRRGYPHGKENRVRV
jgi:hypothetical protein